MTCMAVIRNSIPWDLRNRGLRDSQRHQKKIKEAIRKNLHKIIAEEAIITTNGQKKTKVPVRYLDSYYFKYGKMKDGVGHGPGEEGDILQPGKREGEEGEGNKPGDKPGQDIYDAEISVEELTDMMIEDLGLPWLEDKEKKELIVKHTEFTDLRKKGPLSSWAKRRTVMENIKRNAVNGNAPIFENLEEGDMRFHMWEEKIEKHSNAVVYLMMDRSGSMDDHKRYLCKATFWWLCRFLEVCYDNVEVVFIAHDYEAKVVPEKDFFTLSNDGGTRCSSAYELAWKDIRETRPESIWNVYCFHFSDGDNGDEDNERCVKLVKEMLGRVNMFAYGEVSYENENWVSQGLLEALGEVDHDRLMTAVLEEKEDVYRTLKHFLNIDGDDGEEKEESKKDDTEEPS